VRERGEPGHVMFLDGGSDERVGEGEEQMHDVPSHSLTLCRRIFVAIALSFFQESRKEPRKQTKEVPVRVRRKEERERQRETERYTHSAGTAATRK